MLLLNASFPVKSQPIGFLMAHKKVVAQSLLLLSFVGILIIIVLELASIKDKMDEASPIVTTELPINHTTTATPTTSAPFPIEDGEIVVLSHLRPNTEQFLFDKKDGFLIIPTFYKR